MVYIVDGDAAVRRSLRFALGIDGFTVRTDANAGSFLRRDDIPAHACLVVDHHLVDMSGLDLIERLRLRGWTMPVILTVTNPSSALVRRAASSGIALVEKPLLGTALLDHIRAALSASA
ncbi:hypothetical protein K32_23080 [Kaistia sp. 32K]|uniref:response regulator transcription factor n=1 Tax=Kaistia sp. 32K TaxID=2795690 RepID=UPI0019159E2D|nr:response regulator [Kaistia sp. 32K]BCP53691.1 hypothetical protein K32_23080 [Kaistia sp. 32K]